MTKLSYNELQSKLQENYGTSQYYKRSVFGADTGMVYTDGVHDFCEYGGDSGAQWFVDVVNSYMPNIKKHVLKSENWFFVVSMQASNKDDSGIFRVIQEDDMGNNKDIITQEIPYTDLQRNNSQEDYTEYKFYLIGQGQSIDTMQYILLLPSEY